MLRFVYFFGVFIIQGVCMITFSDRLRIERERNVMTQAEFAAIAGVSRTAQINYEKGERAPNLAYLAAIAQIGCDIQYIVTGERAVGELSSEEIDMINLFRSAPRPFQRMALSSFIKTIKSGLDLVKELEAEGHELRDMSEIQKIADKAADMQNIYEMEDLYLDLDLDLKK